MPNAPAALVEGLLIGAAVGVLVAALRGGSGGGGLRWVLTVQTT